MVLAIGHKFHQYCIVYSWRLYRIVSGETLRQKDLWQHIVGIMIKKSKRRVVSVHSTKAHKVADEVIYDGLGYYPISYSAWKCAVCGKSSRNSCENCKRSLHVKTCFQIFHEKWQYDDTITTACNKKMFFDCFHINKQCILSIPNVFLTCQPQTTERNLS